MQVNDAYKPYTVEPHIDLGPLPVLPCGWRWEGRRLVYTGDKPEEWDRMRVTGAVFKGARRMPGTTMATIVTRDEMDEVELPEAPE